MLYKSKQLHTAVRSATRVAVKEKEGQLRLQFIAMLSKQPQSKYSLAAPRAQHRALRERAQDAKLVLVDVPGDGNCLFSALCRQLRWPATCSARRRSSFTLRSRCARSSSSSC
jgi:hypothetical protein